MRDTPIERKNHESTPKHQHNIQRSLRDLHKNTEREQREKQRAKDEVARLNGLVSGRGGAASGSSTGASAGAGKKPAASAAPQATPEERKRQMAQLAAMGVAVPDEYRREMAIAGEWATVSETPVYRKPVKDEDVKEEDDDEEKLAVHSMGVRKRKLDDEDEQEAAPITRKVWGTSLKSYPGASGGAEEDLDALLSGVTAKKGQQEVKREDDEAKEMPGELKKDESADAEATPAIAAVPEPVVFKKRKSKKT